MTISCPIAPGLTERPLPSGSRPRHNTSQVARMVAASGVGPEKQTDVFPAMVTNPTDPEIHLGPGNVPRLEWVVYGYDIAQSGGEAPGSPAGTVSDIITLVDDATFQLAGTTDCSASPSHP
jgi:hypothetical protein